MAEIKFRGPEKRTYLRVSSRCGVKYAKLSKNLKPLLDMITKSVTEDISAAGVRFIMRKKVPLNTILEFQLRIPGTGRDISGLGEVVRIQPRGIGGSYDVGLKFVWMQRKNIELIDNYVRKKRIQKVIAKLRK